MTDMNLRTIDDPTVKGIVSGPCENCGKPGHKHEKERVNHSKGRWSYNYKCP